MTHQGQAGCFWVGAIVGQFDVVGAYSAGETSYGLARRHDICRNLIRVWVTKAEAAEFDDEVEAPNLLSEYEGKIARWSVWSAAKTMDWRQRGTP